jgi:hypothetical protein
MGWWRPVVLLAGARTPWPPVARDDDWVGWLPRNRCRWALSLSTGPWLKDESKGWRIKRDGIGEFALRPACVFAFSDSTRDTESPVRATYDHRSMATRVLRSPVILRSAIHPHRSRVTSSPMPRLNLTCPSSSKPVRIIRRCVDNSIAATQIHRTKHEPASPSHRPAT